MSSRAPANPTTLAEYQCLPEVPEYREELSRGRLVREPRPGHQHGRVQVRAATALGAFVDEHRLGYVVTESGFHLEHDPDTLRGPDVAFVSRERYGNALPKGYADLAPDLAIEVLSPHDRVSTLLEKVAQYLHAGTRIVWLIDPETRTATVHRPGNEIVIVHEDEELSGEDVLPGFRCGLKRLLDQQQA